MVTIQHGSIVSFEYTLFLQDRTQIESNANQEPFVYEHGDHQIISGLEKELLGMKVGETKAIEVKPEEGYGALDAEAFIEVPKQKIPQDSQVVGVPLEVQDVNGERVSLRIHEVKDETVVLDYNHPLAGKTLLFNVRILNIENNQ
jgi:FKBP-type peptidyl-prolyl cis-trans isomerase 2